MSVGSHGEGLFGSRLWCGLGGGLLEVRGGGVFVG